MAQGGNNTRGWMVGVAFALVALASAWIATLGGDEPATPPAEATPAEASAAAADPAPPPEREEPPTRDPEPDPRARPGARRDVVVVLKGESAKGPVVVGLHGRGDTAANFSRLGPRFSRRLAWRFPQARSPFSRGFAWFTRDEGGRVVGMAEAVEAVHAQVQQAGEGRPVGLFGFSQGCMVILHYVVAHPETVGAAVCVGGRVVGPLATHVSGAARPPILFVNGVEDPVVPAQGTRDAMQSLEALGFPTEHIEHPGGHTVPTEELARMSDWLVRKLPMPAR